jgi:hypothetical protein
MSRPLDRLTWMLEFIRLKFKTVTALEGARLAAVQDQIHAFTSGQLRNPLLDTAQTQLDRFQVRRLSQEDLWRMRDGLQTRIHAWFMDRPDLLVGWKEDGMPRRLLRDKDGKPYMLLDTKDVQTVFFDCAQQLVHAEGERIIKCARPKCDNLLVQEGRSAYCSKRCSQYVRTNKWRQKTGRVENV